MECGLHPQNKSHATHQPPSFGTFERHYLRQRKKIKKKKKTMDIDYAGIGSNYMFLFLGLLSLVVSVNTLLVTFLPLLITLEANSNPMNQGIKT